MNLGGKGANLCAMTQIGLNVPPGFVISTDACLAFLDSPNGDLPPGLMDGVKAHIKDLEKVTAQELMSKKVFTVNESDPIDTVIDIMTTQYIISLPVVKNGKLVGVINRRNILHSMVDHEYQEYFMTIQ